MKGLIESVIVTVMFMSPVAGVYADDLKKGRDFHYGESFTPYGTCRKQLEVHEAMQELQKYVKDRGYTMEMQEMRGRFIKIFLFRDNQHIDSILLDTKTGRIRSIY